MSFKLISSLILVAASLVSVPAFAQSEGVAGASTTLAEGSIVAINGVTFTVIGGVLVASTSKGTTTGTTATSGT